MKQVEYEGIKPEHRELFVRQTDYDDLLAKHERVLQALGEMLVSAGCGACEINHKAAQSLIKETEDKT